MGGVSFPKATITIFKELGIAAYNLVLEFVLSGRGLGGIVIILTRKAIGGRGRAARGLRPGDGQSLAGLGIHFAPPFVESTMARMAACNGAGRFPQAVTTRANSGHSVPGASGPPSSTRFSLGFAMSLPSTASGLVSLEFESLQPDQFFSVPSGARTSLAGSPSEGCCLQWQNKV